jgi:hypothetical protein
MNHDKSNPIFGSIILMHYPLGDLQAFIQTNTFENSNDQSEMDIDP